MKIKLILKRILNFFLFLPINLFLFVFKNKKDYVLVNALNLIEKKGDKYLTYRSYPKREIKSVHNFYKETEDCCIVIQGAYIEKDDFTFNTIKYYVKECKYNVILSTWEGLDPKIVERIEQLGSKVVLSKYPTTCGVLNLNYQVVSTLAGIQEAEKDNYKYVLKTRSDQRLYKQNVLQYFCALLKHFGTERLIAVNYNFNNICWPNYISDFIFFGELDRVKKCFSFKEGEDCIVYNINRTEHYKNIKHSSRAQLSCSDMVPECNIIKNYYKNMGIAYDDTVLSHIENIKKYFIIVSQDEIGLFWKKYVESFNANCRDGLFLNRDNSELALSFNFTFDNWLINYMGALNYSESFEKFKDLSWNLF